MLPLRLTGLTERTFGVEIEFLRGADLTAMRRAAASEGVTIGRPEGYNHQVRDYWKIVSDASVGCGSGHELVSPILKGEDGLRQVEVVSRALKAANAKVDRSCGLHVHHEGKDLTVVHVRNLARLVNRFQGVMNALVPPSRRGAFYAKEFTQVELGRLERATVKTCGGGRYMRDGGTCRQLRGRGARNVCAGCAAARYRSLNLRALHQHGTVEFRQHSGTVEAEKIVPWIMLTQGLVEKAASGGRSRRARFEKQNGDGLKNLMRAAGLQNCRPHGHVVSDAAKERAKVATKYFRERAAKFGVLDMGDNAAARSRAGTSQPRRARTPRERVAAALASNTTASASAS